MLTKLSDFFFFFEDTDWKDLFKIQVFIKFVATEGDI